jgi:hypothetical protein
MSGKRHAAQAGYVFTRTLTPGFLFSMSYLRGIDEA